MRIRTNVVTQSGRILRPAGAVFDIDDATAMSMIADGRATPADGTVRPIASAGIVQDGTEREDLIAEGIAVGLSPSAAAEVADVKLRLDAEARIEGEGPKGAPSGSGASTAAPVGGATAPATGDVDDDVTFFGELGADDAIAFVNETEDAAELAKYLAHEQSREAAREGVIAAIEARQQQLTEQV